MTSSKFKTVVLLSAILLLGGLSIAVIKNGLADFRSASGLYYHKKAQKVDDALDKQSVLQRSLEAFENALVLNPNNSEYHLQFAVSAIEYDQMQKEHDIPDGLGEKINRHLIDGLDDSPTNSHLWSQLARNLARHQGLNDATLLALDKSILYGRNERSTQMISAFITLYYWRQLDRVRQQRGWSLILHSMEDQRLSKQIKLLAVQLGWEQILDDALKDNQS